MGAFQTTGILILHHHIHPQTEVNGQFLQALLILIRIHLLLHIIGIQPVAVDLLIIVHGPDAPDSPARPAQQAPQSTASSPGRPDHNGTWQQNCYAVVERRRLHDMKAIGMKAPGHDLEAPGSEPCVSFRFNTNGYINE